MPPFPVLDYRSVTPFSGFHSRVVFGFLFVVTLLASIRPVNAQNPVLLTPLANNLYNTGIAPDGVTLIGNNQPDFPYTFTTAPAVGTGQAYQTHPLATGWVPNTATSQWISVFPNTFLAPTQAYTYHLTLTNIPVGVLVHIQGVVAADDNAQISANSLSSAFSNFSPSVTSGNFNSFTPFTGVTFVSGTSNTLSIEVDNNGGGATGLNLDLTGSYYTALTSTVGLGIQINPAGLTPNQTSVLNNINQINVAGSNNACFANLTSALLQTSASTLGADLDQLSPEKLGVFSSIAFNDASFRSQHLDDYTAHRRNAQGNFQVDPGPIDWSGLTLTDSTMDPALSLIKSRLLAWNPVPTPGLISDSPSPLTVASVSPAHKDMDSWNFFVSGNVILGQNFSQPELDHTDYTTSSFQLGTDYQIGEHFLVGALFAYNHTDTALDGNGSSATIDGYSPGVFASFSDGGWYANALGTFTFNNYTEQRKIAFGTFDETTNGAPQGDEEMGNLDGGYEFHSGHWTYGPTAGIQYVHLNVDSFTEDGGCSADLSVGNQTADSLRSRFGGRVSYAIYDKSNRVVFTPYLDASWQHEFLAGSRLITSSFAELNGGNFIVATPSTSRDSALVVAGLDADITDNITLFTDYAVQAGENDYFGQSIQAGMKIGF
jgi:uncharacterized protein YhjY with autotransporter beta-barrel domain